MEVHNDVLYEFGPFTLDPSQKLVFRDGAALPLTLKAIEVLLILVENNGRLVTKETLMEMVWSESYVEAGNLTQAVSVLRKYLEDDAQEPRYIKTLARRGYQFVGEVRRVEQRSVELEEHTRATISIHQEPAVEKTDAVRSWRKLLPGIPAPATLMLTSSVLALFLLTWIFTHSRQASANFEKVRFKQFVTESESEVSTLFDPRFSPDGSMIAYAHTGDSQNIWVKQLGGGDAHRVTNGPWRDSSPVWSPDWQRIAFVSNRGGQIGIWAVNFLGGGETLVKVIGDPASEISGGPHLLEKWSNDGSRIYYQWNYNLFSVGVSEGKQEIQQLTHFDGIKELPQFFALSPDETRVAYEELDGNIWQMALSNGKVQKVTTDSSGNRRPVWHKDGNHIFYASDRDGVTRIYVTTKDGGTPAPVTLGVAGEWLADVSVEKESLLTFSQRETSHLYSIDLTSKAEAQLTDSLGREFWPAASPDGSKLIYQAIDHDLAVWDPRKADLLVQALPNRGPATRIAASAYDVTWSPDGRKLAYLKTVNKQTSLWTLDIEGGKEKQITPVGVSFGGQVGGLRNEKAQVNSLGWSPDGSKLAFAMRENGVINAYLVNADGTERNRISDNTDPKRRILCPLWSPRGEKLAFVVDYGRTGGADGQFWEVWTWSQGTVRMIFRSPQYARLVGWDTDQSLVLAQIPGNDPNRTSAKDIDLLRIFTTAGSEERLAKLSSTFLFSINISPGHRNISFISSQGNRENIFEWSFATRGIRQLTANNDPKIHFANIIWAPDEKTIYFAKQTSWSIVKLFENLDLSSLR